MRFVIDAQLPPALARMLTAHGHIAEHQKGQSRLTSNASNFARLICINRVFIHPADGARHVAFVAHPEVCRPPPAGEELRASFVFRWPEANRLEVGLPIE